MFITLGFFCTFQAEKFVLVSKLSRHRAGGTDTALVFRDTHEALPFYAEDQFFCILGTFVVGRTGRADAHSLIFFLSRHHVFWGHPLNVLHHLFEFIHFFTSRITFNGAFHESVGGY